MNEVNESNNFCRVFELPNSYPSDYCFGGGHPVQMLMVDWFNPVRLHEGKTWDVKEIAGIKDFVSKKSYIKSGRKYLILTDFNEAIVLP